LAAPAPSRNSSNIGLASKSCQSRFDKDHHIVDDDSGDERITGTGRHRGTLPARSVLMM
jgi:hypothetical protein